jgi:2-dehydropantoate 2-reductase
MRNSLLQLAPIDRIMGGLCFVCLNRIEPVSFITWIMGKSFWANFNAGPSRVLTILPVAFVTRASCAVTDNLQRTHWEKLVWNIPFNGLGVASAAGLKAVQNGTLGEDPRFEPCLTTDKLLQDVAWTMLVRELMKEIIGAARALGLNLQNELAHKQIERTRTMGAYKASTLIDFERRQPLELHSLFLEPLRQGRAAGFEMPRLAALCRVLEQLDPANPKVQGSPQAIDS